MEVRTTVPQVRSAETDTCCREIAPGELLYFVVYVSWERYSSFSWETREKVGAVVQDSVEVVPVRLGRHVPTGRSREMADV